MKRKKPQKARSYRSIQYSGSGYHSPAKYTKQNRAKSSDIIAEQMIEKYEDWIDSGLPADEFLKRR